MEYLSALKRFNHDDPVGRLEYEANVFLSVATHYIGRHVEDLLRKMLADAPGAALCDPLVIANEVLRLLLDDLSQGVFGDFNAIRDLARNYVLSSEMVSYITQLARQHAVTTP